VAIQLGYQTPSGLEGRVGEGCRQEQLTYLVMSNGAATPERCVKCNAPAEGFWVSKKFSPQTNSPGAGGGGLVALIALVFLIIELSKRKSLTVRLAVCPACRAKRKRAMWMSALLATAGLVIVGVATAMLMDDGRRTAPSQAVVIGLLLAGLAGFFGALVWLGTAVQVLQYHKMDDQNIWLKGAGKAFLESLGARQG
jgi:hypothetical protein